MSHILIVDDDQDINKLVTTILKKSGYEVSSAYSGTEAKMLLEMKVFDLVILDLMLPGLSGEEILTDFRQKMNTPVIVLSAKVDMESKVKALNLGADDYVTKPFAAEEILARVNSQLRRFNVLGSRKSASDNTGDSGEILEFKNLKLYMDGREAKVGGEEISFTAHEFDILEILLRNPGKVFSRDALYETVWKSGYYGEDNTVNVHVSNIRKKLDAVDNENEYIKTVWGIGFKLSN